MPVQSTHQNALGVSIADSFLDLIAMSYGLLLMATADDPDEALFEAEDGSVYTVSEVAAGLANHALAWALEADEQLTVGCPCYAHDGDPSQPLYTGAVPHPVAIAAYRLAATARAFIAFDPASGVDELHGFGGRYFDAVLADPDVQAFLRTYGPGSEFAARFVAPASSSSRETVAP